MKRILGLSTLFGVVLLFLSACTPTGGDPTEYVYYSNGTGLIGTKGGEIYIGDETSIIRDAVCSIKAGALLSPLTFSLKIAADNIKITDHPDARIIDVQPSNVNLLVDAVIGLSYRHLGDVNLNALQIYRFIPSSQELIPLSKPNADETKKVFYGTTSYLGFFVLLADEAPVVTTGSFVDSRDQQSYDWVDINGQKWMAENLNFATSSGSWCYNESNSNCTTYGRLYEINTARSVCPPGWHLPSHEEWQELEANLGLNDPDPAGDAWKPQGFVGKKLKATNGWSSSGNGTDLIGFKALPAGYRDGDGTYHLSGETARFWTSTPIDGDYWARFLMFDDDGIYWGQRSSTRGYSIRCVEGTNTKIPTLTTTTASSITGFTALSGGVISSSGGSAITDRGVCWNTSGYPTNEDPHISLGSGSDTFTATITGLSLETTYYLRAYAVNNDGTGYGDEQIFTTKSFADESDRLTDSRDNKTYDLIRIGNDWWFAENLNFEVSNSSWCYGDNSSNCSTYGRLYNWQAANSSCPPGWKLPSDQDWKNMEVALGMSQSDADKENWRHDGNVGYRMKSTSGWSQNGNGSNDSRFNILPSGFRDGDGTYSYRGEEARFWTSTEGTGGDPWIRFLEYNDDGLYRSVRGPSRGMAVRCIKGQNQSVPTVKTSAESNVSGFTAELGGEVTDVGGSPVYERGICWNLSGNPTISDTKVIMGSGTGSFSDVVKGFSLETNYYVRAYALNSDGMAYGSQITFVTNSIASSTGMKTDTRDGQSYETVRIGNTWWLAENLNFNAQNSSWCYDGSSANCSEYGRLYDWLTATNICMDGWTLPSDDQWKEMEMTLGMSSSNANDINWRHDGNIAVRLKSTSLWVQNGQGTNDSYMNIKPGGFRDVDGSYGFRTQEARFWTATTGAGGDPWIRFLEYNDDGVYREVRGAGRGMSVRCVQGTNASLPVVTTNDASNITGFTASLSGQVTSQGGSSISDKGLCWNTTGYPMISDNKIELGSGSGSFSSDLTGLSVETTYYVRSYAINSHGINYGEEKAFTTSSIASVTGEITDVRDSKKYKTIHIGGEWWMAENLNFEIADGSWCYDGSSGNCDEYGRLYKWETAQVACPAGWEVPSDSDWKSMEIALGMSIGNANDADWRHDGSIALKLKSTSGWADSGNGNNSSLMNVKPGGFRDADGTFDYINQEARFWTSSGTSNDEAWSRFLQYNDDGVYRKERGKDRGMSVRCIKK